MQKCMFGHQCEQALHFSGPPSAVAPLQPWPWSSTHFDHTSLHTYLHHTHTHFDHTYLHTYMHHTHTSHIHILCPHAPKVSLCPLQCPLKYPLYPYSAHMPPIVPLLPPTVPLCHVKCPYTCKLSQCPWSAPIPPKVLSVPLKCPPICP